MSMLVKHASQIDEAFLFSHKNMHLQKCLTFGVHITPATAFAYLELLFRYDETTAIYCDVND